MSDARWPILMDAPTACKYLTYTRRHFEALLRAGLMPQPRAPIEGEPRWHRRELDRAVDRLFDIEMESEHERARASARRALDAFDPAAARRGNGGRGRPDLPVLPSRRTKNPAPVA
jgi:hypothetical protein